jgi:glycosyltransferase involved in cell wall biosynthesis
MFMENEKKKILIFIVCYHAQDFIEFVLARIPQRIWEHEDYKAEVLIIDDQSNDQTFYKALDYSRKHNDLKITVFRNSKNQGYGGNQKIGYHYAIQNGFHAVVLLHGDGQYAPEALEDMIAPIINNEADVVLGSRMISKENALKGKMPLYKWIGNISLTLTQNLILGSHLAEFHTGYRAFSVAALSSVPFEYNSDYYDFDTDILIQMLDKGVRISEISIPTFYGEEVSRVRVFKYGWLIIKSSLLSRIMKFGILYHPKFDYDIENSVYTLKLGYPSSHTFALDRIQENSMVLDLGCGPGLMSRELSKKGARIISVDQFITPMTKEYSYKSIQSNIEDLDQSEIPEKVDTVLILDLIEHLRSPESFLYKMREQFCGYEAEFIITTGNIGFLPIRLGLLFGQFNYGKRGILDITHTRLFTFYSLRRLLIQSGFEILEEKGIPAPFPLAFNNKISHLLVRINEILIRLLKSVFSYQMFFVVKPRPTLKLLLQRSKMTSEDLIQKFDADKGLSNV